MPSHAEACELRRSECGRSRVPPNFRQNFDNPLDELPSCAHLWTDFIRFWISAGGQLGPRPDAAAGDKRTVSARIELRQPPPVRRSSATRVRTPYQHIRWAARPAPTPPWYAPGRTTAAVAALQLALQLAVGAGAVIAVLAGRGLPDRSRDRYGRDLTRPRPPIRDQDRGRPAAGALGKPLGQDEDVNLLANRGDVDAPGRVDARRGYARSGRQTPRGSRLSDVAQLGRRRCG